MADTFFNTRYYLYPFILSFHYNSVTPLYHFISLEDRFELTRWIISGNPWNFKVNQTDREPDYSLEIFLQVPVLFFFFSGTRERLRHLAAGVRRPPCEFVTLGFQRGKRGGKMSTSSREEFIIRRVECGAVSEVRIMKFTYSDSKSHYRGHLAASEGGEEGGGGKGVLLDVSRRHEGPRWSRG